jgi:PAS domain-containing protein
MAKYGLVEQRDHMRTCETLRDANQRLEVTDDALRIENVERRRIEQALRESEYKLRQIIDTVPGLIWSAGPDGEPTHVSQRLLDYSGMRFEDFKHVVWKTLVHPDDFPETAKASPSKPRRGSAAQNAETKGTTQRRVRPSNSRQASNNKRATTRSPFPYCPTIDALPYASLIDNVSYPTRCHGSVSMCGVGAGAF